MNKIKKFLEKSLMLILFKKHLKIQTMNSIKHKMISNNIQNKIRKKKNKKNKLNVN